MFQMLALFAQETSEKGPPPAFDPTLLIMMAGIFAAFYFIVILPGRRREKKEREDLFTKLKKNDEVLTSSGLIGIVAMVKDDEVILKVDESSNVRLRVLKSAIVRIMNPKDAPAGAGQDAATGNSVKAGSPPAKSG
jgi:preprotein translocase subunit YajC